VTHSSDQPVLSKAVTEVVGLKTFDIIVRSSQVTMFQVDPRDQAIGSGEEGRFAGYRVLKAAPAQGAAYVRRLSSLVGAEGTYHPIEKKACTRSLGFGFRFEAKGERVELLLFLPCQQLLFARRATGDAVTLPAEYVDPAAAQFAELLREAFPGLELPGTAR
jgi:hypothetical protein